MDLSTFLQERYGKKGKFRNLAGSVIVYSHGRELKIPVGYFDVLYESLARGNSESGRLDVSRLEKVFLSRGKPKGFVEHALRRLREASVVSIRNEESYILTDDARVAKYDFREIEDKDLADANSASRC